MKKLHVLLLCVFLVIITAMTTFFVTTIFQVETGDKVVVSQTTIDDYQTTMDQYREIEELKNYIKTNYYLEVSDEELIEGMKKGIFDVLEDPYSVFMNEEEFQDYMESSSGEYPGIGIYLAPNEDNEIEIVSPIEDTPADRAGLIAKDLIIGVNGDTVNADVMDEAIATIKGEPGTPVTLTIYRPSKKEKFDVEIVREWIDIKVVKTRMLEDQIGYLRLTMFDESSAAEFEKGLKALIAEGAKGVIVDLRQNPGGYLSQCVEIADMLLGDALIVYTESRNGDDEEYFSDPEKYDTQLVILVDGGSASASEILTGALKDHEAATIVGTTTFGKGVVQIVKPYNENTGFKLTTSQYFTPDGMNIHGIGIEPDVVIEMDEAYYELESPTDADDNQLQKALEIMKTKLQ
ncbi:MAG: S41 family peptidase [Firmicutes bacterium]|nr:S41 family peptidase [Bacillota bacterium]